VGRSPSAAASSRRPRGIVGGARPVMCATSGSPPWPRRLDSTAADHRRCGSSKRASSTFIWWCRAGSGGVPACWPCGHGHRWTSALGMARSHASEVADHRLSYRWS
jgi:hypothetical protein